MLLFIADMKVVVKDYKADYTEYLGPNYLQGYKKIKKTSAIVSTHSSWLDGFIMGYLFQAAMTPAADVIGEVPMFATIFESLDSIIAYRGSDMKRREKVKEDL